MAKRIYTEIRIHHQSIDEKEQFERQLDAKVKAAGFSNRAEYIRVILNSDINISLSVRKEKSKMNTKKMVIWENKNESYYIDPESINEVVIFTNQSVYKISGIPVEHIDNLNELLKDREDRLLDEYDLEDFLKEQGYSEFEIRMALDIEDFPDTEGHIYYDAEYEYNFFALNDCETTESYQWWDGSNWRQIFKDDFEWCTEVVIDEDTERCLDEWDGSNWWTGSKFCHQYVYNILEVDGEKPEEPTFLVVYTCQYQDSHPSAEIMTEEELREHLKELGRDANEYIPAK